MDRNSVKKKSLSDEKKFLCLFIFVSNVALLGSDVAKMLHINAFIQLISFVRECQ